MCYREPDFTGSHPCGDCGYRLKLLNFSIFNQLAFVLAHRLSFKPSGGILKIDIVITTVSAFIE